MNTRSKNDVGTVSQRHKCKCKHAELGWGSCCPSQLSALLRTSSCVLVRLPWSRTALLPRFVVAVVLGELHWRLFDAGVLRTRAYRHLRHGKP